MLTGPVQLSPIDTTDCLAPQAWDTRLCPTVTPAGPQAMQVSLVCFYTLTWPLLLCMLICNTGPAVRQLLSDPNRSAHKARSNSQDVAAVPTARQTATAATRRMPRLANSSGGSTAECLQLQLRKPGSNMSGAACSSGSGRIVHHAQPVKPAETSSADPAAAAWSAPRAPAATGSKASSLPSLIPCQAPSLDRPVAQQQPTLRSQAAVPNQTASAESGAQQAASKQADAAGPSSTTRITVEELLACWRRKRKAADGSVGADAGCSNDPAAGEQAAETTAGRVPYDIPAPPCPAQWPQLVEWARGVLALKRSAAMAAAGGPPPGAEAAEAGPSA